MAKLEIEVHERFLDAPAASPALEKAGSAFEQLGEMVADAIEPLQEKLSALDEAVPDQVELGLALGFKGGGQWVVVSGDANATVTLKLKWKLAE